MSHVLTRPERVSRISSSRPASETTAACLEHVPSVPVREQAAAQPGADREPERPRHEGEPGVQRREALADLQEERQHKQDAGHPEEEDEQHQRPRGVAAVAEQARLDQGVLAGARAQDLLHREDGEQDDAARERCERPGGPAGLASLDQRIDQSEHRRADDRRAEQVDTRRRRGAHFGHQESGADRGGDPERHVDEEDQPPAAEPVHAHEQPADDRSEHGGAADHRPEQRERLRQLVLREDRAHDPEPLRDQQGPEGTLREAKRHEHRRGAGEPARERADGEAQGADHEQTTTAEAVAHPPADDQSDREGERVAAGDPLQSRLGGMQMTADRGQSDVHDRPVEEIHDLCGEDDEQDQPAAGMGIHGRPDSVIVPNIVRERISERCIIQSWPRIISQSPPPPPQRRARTGRQRGLDRAAVVEAAVRVLDAEGLEAVTLRRVAHELGVGAASLYAYVDSKDVLVELMLDQVLGEVDLSDLPDERALAGTDQGRYPAGTRDLRRARGYRAGDARAHSRPARTRSDGMETMLAVLRHSDLPDQVVAYAGDLIGLLVGAAAFEDSLFRESGVGFDEMLRFVGEFRRYLESLPADRFPNLVELAGPLTRVSPDEDERFEFMLNVIVDGLAAQR